MAVTFKLLGNGQLPITTPESLYTVPALTTAAVKAITLHNTHTGVVTTEVYITKSGSSARKICGISLSAGYDLVLPDLITLGAGDMISGVASVDDKVDYTVSGVEKT